MKRILLMCEFEKSNLAGGEAVLLRLAESLSKKCSPAIVFSALTTESMAPSLRMVLDSPHKVLTRPRKKMVRLFEHTKQGIRRIAPGMVKNIKVKLGVKDQGMPDKVEYLSSFYPQADAHLVHWLYPLHFAISSIPSVCTIHDLNYEHLDDFSPSYIKYRRLLMQRQAETSDALVAISDVVAADFLSRYPLAVSRTSVIRHGVDLSDLSKEQSNRAFEDIAKIGDFIFYPAATYDHKNHRRLVQAIQILNQARKNPVRLVLSGPQTENWFMLKAEFAELVSSRQLIHRGFVHETELRALYQACRVVVFPSLFEGAGLPVIESMALGCSLACSNLPVFKEYAGNYPTYFDPRSPTDIAQKVDSLLSSRCLRTPPSRLPSWDDAAQNYLSIYHRLLF